MKNLNKDEKKYINTELIKRITEATKTPEITGINTLINESILDNPKVSQTLKFLETIFTKDEIAKHITVRQTYGRQGNFYFELNNYSINITVDLEKEVLDEIEKRNKLQDYISDLRYKANNINLEKYYIMFSTWKGTSSERLDKINELIDLICYEEFKI